MKILLASSMAVACLAFLGCQGTTHIVDPTAGGPYSSAVTADHFVFLAGKVGRDRDSFEAEVHSAIDRVEGELAALELSLADIVSVNVYVTDIERYEDVNTIYRDRFPEPYPARTFVGVQALPGGAQIEIQAIARRS